MMMGREIRRVPPNWEHPKSKRYGDDRYEPQYGRSFEDAAAEWKKQYALWESGERPSYCEGEERKLEFWEWHGQPPKRNDYVSYKPEDATWYQVYETVSEGTPVSPPFATQEELIEYLVKNGDFWDQKRGDGPYSRSGAESFVRGGWAPSFIVTDGKVQSGVESLADE